MNDDKCPKCGESAVNFYDSGGIRFDCGSSMHTNGEVEQSQFCYSKQLEQQLDAARGEIERLREIVSFACGYVMPGLEDTPHAAGRLPSACKQLVKSEQALDAECKRLQTEVSAYRQEVRQLHRYGNAEYWRWQGDGSDHLESLTCPVLIDAKDLAALSAAAQAENKRFREALEEFGRYYQYNSWQSKLVRETLSSK